MIKNYLLIAFRTLVREKGYAFLNVAGLAVGISCLVFVYTYLRFEYSYDKFHANADRIYRITEEFEDDAQRVKSAMSHSPLAEIISDNLSSVEHVVRVYPISGLVSSNPETKYRESRFCFADSLFFETFSFNSLDGSLDEALAKPFSVVLTKSMAIKYFGSIQIVGRELVFEDESESYSYSVTAVIADPPQNSHMNFDFVASFSTLTKYMPWHNNWYHPAMYVYLLAKAGTSHEVMQGNVSSVISAHEPEEVREEKRSYNVQPLSDIHLHSNLEFEWQANSNIRYLQAFMIVGVSILLIAIINFINLTTARVARRAKEIGVRKVFGAVKRQLVAQFIVETFLYVTCGFIVALMLAEFALREVMAAITEKNISVLELMNTNHILFAFGLILIVTFLAGAYPSFVMSRFLPVKNIKQSNAHNRNVDLRKALVTFQFIVSSLMISLTAIISSQVNFFKTKNLGFDKDFIVSINLSDRFAQKNYASFKESLLRESGVSSVALSSSIPGNGQFHGFEIVPEGTVSDHEVNIKTLGIDEDFLNTYQIPIISGRDFSLDIASDQTEAFILNRAAAKKLGWSDPIGRELELTVYINGPKKRKGKVIGLVGDFNFESLRSDVEPLLLYINKHPYFADFLSVRMQPGNIGTAIVMLEKNWKAFNPGKPMEFQFLNDGLSKLYNYEMKVSRIFIVLTLVAVIISALGLFGLASFMAVRKMKEMSIRKIFGATLNQLIIHQYRGYLAIFAVASLVVVPVSWILANEWLKSFANRVDVGLQTFAIPLLISFLIISIATIFQSFSAATKNPIDIIRNE